MPARNIINLILVDGVVMSLCSIISWVVGKGCFLCAVCSLYFVPLHFVLQGQNFSGYLLNSYFVFLSPMTKSTTFFGVSHRRYWGFPDSSVGKESACSAGDPGSTHGSGRSTREWIGYPFQYSWASLVWDLTETRIMNFLLPNSD